MFADRHLRLYHVYPDSHLQRMVRVHEAWTLEDRYVPLTFVFHTVSLIKLIATDPSDPPTKLDPDIGDWVPTFVSSYLPIVSAHCIYVSSQRSTIHIALIFPAPAGIQINLPVNHLVNNVVS